MGPSLKTDSVDRSVCMGSSWPPPQPWSRLLGCGGTCNNNIAHGSPCVLEHRKGSGRANGWLWRLLGGNEWRGSVVVRGTVPETVAVVPFGGLWVDL